MNFPTQNRKLPPGPLLLSLFVGLAAGLTVYNFFLTRLYPPTSRRVLLMTAVACVAGAVGYYLLLERRTAPAWKVLKPAQRLLILAASALLGIYLLLAGTNALKAAPETLVMLAPDQTVEIRVPVDQATPNVDITILYFSTDAGDVSFDAAAFQGWEKIGARLLLTDPANNSFRWTGKTGEKAILVFERSPGSGEVVVSWNGISETINLAHRNQDKYFYNAQFPVPFYASREAVFTLALVAVIGGMIPICLLVWSRQEQIQYSLSEAVWPNPPPGAGQIKKGTRQKWALIIAIMLLALLPRVLFLGREIFYVDELSHLAAAKDLVAGAPLDSVYQRSLYVVTLPVAFFIKLFGTQLWAAKLPGVLINTLAIIPLFLILDKVNRTAAVLACVLYASNPWLIGVARAVREYAYYPFYFYWIVYGMISLIEMIPQGFVITRDWRKLANWRLAVRFIVVLLPMIYAVYVDVSSTFKIIGIAYGVFFFFLLTRLDLKNKLNYLILLTTTLALTGLAFHYLLGQPDFSILPVFDDYALKYFFPNPAQQIYYERLVVPLALALLVSFFLSAACFRKNIGPSFFSALFLISIVLISFFWDRYVRPRYFISLQSWFMPLLGIGLVGLWVIFRRVVFHKPLASVVAIVFLALSVNPGQALSPAFASESGSRTQVTEEYQYNMEPIEDLLLNEAGTGELLISNIYGSYAAWKGTPDLQILRPPSYLADEARGGELQNYVYSLVKSYGRGWIVLDSLRRWSGLPREDIEIDGKTIEYLGRVAGQLIWRW